jgi:putrescine transport system permease protein
MTTSRFKLGRRFVIGVPYLWLVIFFALPALILLRISVTDMGEGLDPFAPILRQLEGQWQLVLKLDNYFSLFNSTANPLDWQFGRTLYTDAFLLSLKYASLTTVLCLVLGYPFAYFLARAPEHRRPILLMVVMLPFWTSFLLRVYAWKGILADQGLINNLLMWSGLTQEPVPLLYNDVSMLLGMTYVYCPFMILPLYATLVKMDLSLLEAAHDLGASPWEAFWLVTVPLSRPGIVAGAMLVFIPALGEFVIPSLLGGAENLMLGRVIWDEMFSSNNWPRASALSMLMVFFILLPLAWQHRRRAPNPEQGAGA